MSDSVLDTAAPVSGSQAADDVGAGLPGLPRARANYYSVSVLVADTSAGALSALKKQLISTVEVLGHSQLPALREVAETSFVVTAHQPTALTAGDLLVVDQATGRVMLIGAGGASRPYLEVSSWCRAHLWDTAVNSDRSRLYLSLSGMRSPTANHVGVAGSSAVLEIDTATGELTRAITAFDPATGVAYTDRMLDLAGLVVTPDDQRVLVCDFNNWQGNGKVISIDLATGEPSVLTEGLDQPSTLSVDGPDHVLVANTRQPHGKASGGQIVRVNIHTGDQEVIADLAGVSASLIGVVRLPDGSFGVSMSEGTQEQCVVAHVDADGSGSRVLWHPKPGFVGSGISLAGDSLFVAETLRKRVYELGFDGAVRRHLQVYDSGGDDEIEFLFRGFDTLESVKVVR